LATASRRDERKNDSLKDWLTWQESLHVVDIELGLERCNEIAQTLQLTRPAKTVVTVAGTNGKGSSVAMLESIWRAAGYTVGTYTSPHLIAYNERIRLNGEPASDADICAAFERVEYARDGRPLTYFEFGTLAALTIFSEAMPDVAILEVGLGGRLDAVNIIDADVSLIATIGIDHVEFLGTTRDAISLEKAGIMRPGKSAVCSDIDVPQTLKEYSQKLPTELEILGVTYRFSDEGETWSWWSGDAQIVNLPKPSLLGEHQLANAAGVLKVVDILQPRLPTGESDIAHGLQKTKLQGRFHVIPGDIEVVLDVAHNAQAVEIFVRTLQLLEPANKTHVILGMMRVKDREGAMRLLAPIADSWHLASINAARGARSEELQESLNRAIGKRGKACLHESATDAYMQAKSSAQAGDRIIAIGSFLVVSEILNFVQ
jgi:dihydrofolate synthase / folylpolyglutamate synthase